MWGISSNQENEEVSSFVAQYGITFPILMDYNGHVAELYRQEQAFPSAAFPQDWIIDADGLIIYQNNGFEIDAMQTALDAELE